MKKNTSAVIGAFALLALGSAGEARGELATVADGFTDPPTLAFGGAAGPFIDGFDGAELDPCLWGTDAGGGYSGSIQSGSYVVSGEGFGDPNTFVGFAFGGQSTFSDGSFTQEVVVDAVPSQTWEVNVGAGGSGEGPRDYVSAELNQQSDGRATLRISLRDDSSEVVRQEVEVAPEGSPLVPPFTLRLTVDRDGGTITATLDDDGDVTNISGEETPLFTEFSTRIEVRGLQGGDLAIDSFSSTMTTSPRYLASNSPLSVGGVDYTAVPFGGEPTLGLIFLLGGQGQLVTQDDACVSLDGSEDISAALVTFPGPAHVTIFTNLDEATMNQVAQSQDPPATLDCYGAVFTSNGAGSDYTFVAPDCVAQPTATPTEVGGGPTATPTDPPAPTPTEPPAPTATATNPPAPTATATNPPAPTATATDPPAPTATNTSGPAGTPTETEVPVDTATPTITPTPTATATPTRGNTIVDTLCRKQLFRATLYLAQSIDREIYRCHASRMRGDVAPGVDCNDDDNALSATRIARAEDKLMRRAENACAGGRREAASDPDALGFASCPAPCDSIDIDNTFEGVVACLSCVAEAEIEALGDAVYGAPPVPLSKDGKRCQIRIARGASGYVSNRGKAQQTCQQNLDRAKLPEGTDCQTHDPRGKAAKAQANAEKGIARSCTDAAAGLDACGSDVASLQSCVVDAARTAADALFNAVYRPLE